MMELLTPLSVADMVHISLFGQIFATLKMGALPSRRSGPIVAAWVARCTLEVQCMDVPTDRHMGSCRGVSSSH